MKKAHLFLLFALWGCSLSQPSEFQSLVGQGPIPVSTTNAFVGGNLFLTHEFERSPFLYKFLKGRGAPLAVEIKDGSNMKLFYPRQREYFQGTLIQDEHTYNWITRGPFRMSREDFLRISDLEKIKAEPIFQSRGKTFRFIEEAPVQPTPIVMPTVAPPVKPKKKKTPVITNHDGTSESKEGKVEPTPTPNSKFTFDQMAIQMSRGYAERNQAGDIIHTTKKEGESLKDIAAWYTGSADNAQAIATRNDISVDGTIIEGARITIPANLVKETKAMK